MNLRGEVVAVLDLAQLVGLPTPSARNVDPSVVILRVPETWGARGQGRAACGLQVDKLLGVRDIEGDALRAPPPSVEAEAASYLRGVAQVGDPPVALAVLDPDRVLASERLKPYRRKS
jgi:chemotaxis signal transduction protein